jgi:hypothetical protein
MRSLKEESYRSSVDADHRQNERIYVDIQGVNE